MAQPARRTTGPYDLLSQWRGYGRGGYALAFHRGALEAPPALLGVSSDGEASRPLISEVGLLRVEYADAAQELILSRATAAIITPDDHDIGTGRSTRLASLAAAGIKHSAFREEREWRYVVTGGRPSERFRVSPTGLVIPYLDIPLNLRASLVSISVGPSDGQDQFRLEQRVAGVERLLAVHGLASAVEVVPSAIPFREI